MIAFTALAVASCSNMDDVSVSQAELNRSKYDQAFLNYVGGSIPSNQTWGFSSTTTRANVNVNGNLWHSIPSVSPEEKAKVFAHVNKDKSKVVGATEEFPENLVNYWVTQVWTGEDEYTNREGTSTFVGSSKMNNLQIAETTTATITNGDLSTTGWFHVNNFNRGDNTDWSGNTLIAESGTRDFAYHSSEDNNYHNRWIAVPGSAIDASLAGYYYICFDFQAVPDGCYTEFENTVTENGTKYYVDGAYDSAADAIAAGLKAYQWAWDGATQTSYKQYFDIDSRWTQTQIVSGNMAVSPNNVYTDWIIRLVAAQPKDENSADLRIIAEDLSASQDGDFDFNDIVLDIKYGTPAVLTLQAAGGTLPLRINGDDNLEVHKLFDADNAVNTGRLTRNAVVINSSLGFTKAINSPEDAYTLKIEVFKDGEWQELTAKKGEPACKLAVDPDYPWLREKQSIKGEYPLFLEWATNANFTSQWW